MSRNKLRATLVALGLLCVTGAIPVAPAAAASFIFPVMNTSETPPDGVWYRNSPHTWDTARETGWGIYMYEYMQVDCWLMGDAVGPYNNHLWYRGINVTRPTVNGHPNSGFMNAHYINDGMLADQPYPGVLSCDAPPPPPPPPANLVSYYSGLGSAGSTKAQQVGVHRNLTEDGSFDGKWTPSVQCVPDAGAINFGGQAVSRLAGWSLGRLGPIYALKYFRDHDPAAAARINYVILFDPGSPATFGRCDYDRSSVQADSILAWWLGLSPDNRLVVMSGRDTATNHHESIQRAYFPAIKRAGSAVRSRVLVCNFNLNHQATYNNYAYLMTDGGRLGTAPGWGSCPKQGGRSVWGWNP